MYLRLLKVLNILIIIMALSSCVSYDTVSEGAVNTPYMINGSTVIMDKGEDKVVVLGIRNDSPEELLIKVRPIGGEIGYDFYGGGNSGFGSSPNNTIRAAYLTRGNTAALSPGEEAFVTIFLKNWYLANKKFKHRMEVVIDNGVERHALNIYVTQDDIFENAAKTFTDNKLGKNDPGRNGAIHIGAGGLSANYTLTIPLN